MNLALKKPEIGIFSGMTNKDYHAAPGLSSSGLAYIAKSPAHYLAYKQNPPEETKAMVIGSAVHSAFLEDGIETGAVLKAPGNTRRDKVFKEFAAAHPGGILLLEDEIGEVQKITDALRAHPGVRALIKDGKAEQSAFWEDPETGILCKCRPDYLRDDGIVIDLKTSQDASRKEFEMTIMSRKYHWQSAWYLDGLSLLTGRELKNFVHIVVEKEAPYGIGIYVLDDGSLEKAREDIKKLKERFSEALHTGEWPGYSMKIENIALPSWAFHQEAV